MAFEDKDNARQADKVCLLGCTTQIPNWTQKWTEVEKKQDPEVDKTRTGVDPGVDKKFETAKHAENSKAKSQAQENLMYWGKPPGQTQGGYCGYCTKHYMKLSPKVVIAEQVEAHEEEASASSLAGRASKHNNKHYEEEARASALAAQLRAEMRQDAQDEKDDKDSTDSDMPHLVSWGAI